MRKNPEKKSKIELIFTELKAHLPFTFLGVVTAVGVLILVHWMLVVLGKADQFTTYRTFFHTFHFFHVFLSAMASSALYYRLSKNIPRTVLVGFLGTLIPCGLSDIILPYLGGKLLGLPIQFHLCLIEEPGAVLFANGAGIIGGMLLERIYHKASHFSHSAHVFISSFASLFYLATFGIQNWMSALVGIFIITAIAVVIPCCSSDIIIPVSLLAGFHGHEHEDEHTCAHSVKKPAKQD